MQVQLEAAIHIAIACVAGTAGHTPYRITMTNERYWRWEYGGSARWIIPYRVERRVQRLVEMASRSELMARGGRCATEHVITRLQRWRMTGHWQRVIRPIWTRACAGEHIAGGYGEWIGRMEQGERPRRRRGRGHA